MARKFYTKEQAAEMLVMSEDESDIDNFNDQTIYDDDSDTKDMDTSAIHEQTDQHSPLRPPPAASSYPPPDQSDWKIIDCDSDLTLPKFTFLGVPGLKPDWEECVLSTADDYEMIKKSLELFLTDDLLNDLVTFTNIRADQYLQAEFENLKPHSRLISSLRGEKAAYLR